MTRPVPTRIYHFTRVEHLPSIVEEGLLSDTLARSRGLTQIEIGHSDIKRRRRRRPIEAGPRGFVGDYVPFYFASRSRMMYTLNKGGGESMYSGGFDRVVYLVATCESVSAAGCRWIVSNRNAAQDLARFRTPDDDLDSFIDWPLMSARQWGWCEEDPERPDRREAECLVHRVVPWAAFTGIAAKNQTTAAEARTLIGRLGSVTPVSVRGDWYF